MGADPEDESPNEALPTPIELEEALARIPVPRRFEIRCTTDANTVWERFAGHGLGHHDPSQSAEGE